MKKNEKKYWRNLDEQRNAPLKHHQSSHWPEQGRYKDGPDFSRRSFLGIMAASAALAGLAGCRRPVEKIVPYVKQPEEVIPGVPSYYATTMPIGTSAVGLIVECHEGRPTKIEGNPAHPSSFGATDAVTQASILNLYDPDRSQDERHQNVTKNYDDFVAFWREKYEASADNRGQGLAVISESFASPTLARLKRDFEKKFREAQWATYEPISNENRDTAVRQLTGKSLTPVYRYDKAKVIVSLDADFLQTESENIAAAARFAEGREIENPSDDMNRLYIIESQFSVTGGMADNRLTLRSGDIGQFILSLAKELDSRGLNLGEIANRATVQFDKKRLAVIAEDLINNRGESLLVAGRRQPPWVHESVLIINEALDNFGQTIDFYEDEDTIRSSTTELKSLADSINRGNVDTLIIFGGNPVYDGPADLTFTELLKKVRHVVHLSEYFDETSRLAEWHIPRTHYLESWGDTRAVDGTVGVIQPMIAPLYDGHADAEFLSLLVTGRDLRGYEIVRETWQRIIKGDFEKGWRKVLHNGLYDGKKEPILPRLRRSQMSDPEVSAGSALKSDKIEAVFCPSFVYDGRFANNGWLQELPDPISKLVWDNAAIMSPGTAKKLKVANKDVVKITVGDKSVELPVWIVPGTADYSIGLALGYGHRSSGRVGNQSGFDVYPLRNTSNMHYATDVKIRKTGATVELANTQDHNRMEGRPIAREATLKEYRSNPDFAREMVEHPPLESLYPDHDYSKGYQWGMVIDLNTCIGCGACTIACQSENNIPIVGKEQVGNGREMHWLRIDRYFTGEESNPEMVHMPVPCQHCENAPCESVCPVAATVHDKEGLNNMTYNRCIGTRYCSNNCPYKVRKFNFFNYTGDMPETVKMVQNPDVTVRYRGVMEKCTFCIQRINRVKREAKKDNRSVADREIVTACQQACPTKAIRFGNINDPDSEVARLKKNSRNYALLAEFNVRPRNSYLAKIRNPHSDSEENET